MTLTKLTFTGKTDREYDSIALDGGVLYKLGAFGTQYHEYEVVSKHYAARAIGTYGMGNCGNVVLIGLSAHGKHMLRVGRFYQLRKAGVAIDIANTAVYVKYGNELAVCAMAEKAIGYFNLVHESTPEQVFRIAKSLLKLEGEHMTESRLRAAVSIAEACAAKRGGK